MKRAAFVIVCLLSLSTTASAVSTKVAAPAPRTQAVYTATQQYARTLWKQEMQISELQRLNVAFDRASFDLKNRNSAANESAAKAAVAAQLQLSKHLRNKPEPPQCGTTDCTQALSDYHQRYSAWLTKRHEYQAAVDVKFAALK